MNIIYKLWCVIVFLKGINGVIYGWNVDLMEEKYQMGGEVNGKLLLRSHDDAVLDLLNVSFNRNYMEKYDNLIED